MSTVEEIERAVGELSPDELKEFRHWFAEFDATLWDAQIEEDARSGKLDAIAAEARAEYERGEAREI